MEIRNCYNGTSGEGIHKFIRSAPRRSLESIDIIPIARLAHGGGGGDGGYILGSPRRTFICHSADYI